MNGHNVIYAFFSNAITFFCSVLSVHLTSSKSLVGITGVASEIQKEKKVYLPPLICSAFLCYSGCAYAYAYIDVWKSEKMDQ